MPSVDTDRRFLSGFVSSPIGDARGQSAARLASLSAAGCRGGAGQHSSAASDSPSASRMATAVLVATALPAFIAAQPGLAIGAQISERLRERAEQVAGVALLLGG